MPNQILKETIAEYGFEETLAAMIELIREEYLKAYPLNTSNVFRFQLEAALANWSLDTFFYQADLTLDVSFGLIKE